MVCYDVKKKRPAMEIPLHLKLTTPGYHFARVFLSFLLLWMIYCSSHYDAKTTVHLYIFFHFMNNTVKIHNRKNLHVPYLLVWNFKKKNNETRVKVQVMLYLCKLLDNKAVKIA